MVALVDGVTGGGAAGGGVAGGGVAGGAVAGGGLAGGGVAAGVDAEPVVPGAGAAPGAGVGVELAAEGALDDEPEPQAASVRLATNKASCVRANRFA